jgi:hypothetical protein
LADFIHKRQLRQEAQARLDQPLSENVVQDSENEKQGDVDHKLAGTTIQDGYELTDIK